MFIGTIEITMIEFVFRREKKRFLRECSAYLMYQLCVDMNAVICFGY